jgi:hypothetical protein
MTKAFIIVGVLVFSALVAAGIYWLITHITIKETQTSNVKEEEKIHE